MWKKLFKILAWVVTTLILVTLLTFTTVDWSDYREQNYYLETMKALEEIQLEEGAGDYLLAGWASVNSTPESPQNLVGYKPRGNYEFVQDSSYVKALVLENGGNSVVFLNYELLIVHPVLAERVEKRVMAELLIDKVYLTATHTHSGMGGYMPGLLGKFGFGGYEETVVEMLEEKTLSAIQSALGTMDTVQMAYKKTKADDFVMNRFVAEDPVDPYLRQLVFTKNSGEKGTLITYSAHATCLSSRFMGLSGDYPKYLTTYLEQDNVDFALFAAGTVGSHRPMAKGKTIADVEQYAFSLDSIVTTSPKQPVFIPNPKISFATLPLSLREAHFRVSDHIRLRPWAFDFAFGETNAHFDIVLLGNVLMISSSGEISGVFYEKWERMAEQNGLHLIITTFNGGYIGYITPDEYYNHNFHEVREMNWFGPYNGAYFDEIIRGIIESAAFDPNADSQ